MWVCAHTPMRCVYNVTGRAPYDPLLIIAQMCVLQTAFYFVAVGLVALLDTAAQRPVCLWCMFAPTHMSVWAPRGRALLVAYVVAAIACTLLLPVAGVRARRCWDFVGTVYVLHLALCWWLGGWPHWGAWWYCNMPCCTASIFAGEYLCMRVELRDIQRM